MRVSSIRKEIIDTLSQENKKLNEKIIILEDKVLELEKKVEVNLQYQRQSSIVLSGIPQDVEHSKLEEIVLKVFNSICYHTITWRDITSPKVLVKFVNRRDATSFLDGKTTLDKLNNAAIDLAH